MADPSSRAQKIVHVSVSTSGAQANRTSFFAMISGNGRYVAFASEATNLVPGARDGVYVREVQTRRTELVSVAGDGAFANDLSWYPSISGSGRYVAFMSRATNLVPGDTNGVEDVFVRDRQTRRTQRVSVGSDGSQLTTASLHSSISADGRYIGFVTGSNSGQGEAMVHDRRTGATIRLSTPMGGGTGGTLSEAPVLSADGRYAAFMSGASDLVPNDTNGTDIFVYEMATGQLSLASVGFQGQSNGWAFLPAISGNGRYVTFTSQATNLVPGHTGFTSDLYVRDRVAGVTTLVSVADDGTLSNDDSWGAAMDYSGRYIVHCSAASNLVPGDTNGRPDTLLYDQQTGHNRILATGIDGAYPNAGSCGATLDTRARHVAFESEASNLIPGDTNTGQDIFITTRPR